MIDGSLSSASLSSIFFYLTSKVKSKLFTQNHELKKKKKKKLSLELRFGITFGKNWYNFKFFGLFPPPLLYPHKINNLYRKEGKSQIKKKSNASNKAEIIRPV